MDEVFGETNFGAQITLTKAASQSSELLAGVNDYLLWYAKDSSKVKYHGLFEERPPIDNPTHRYICVEDSQGNIHDLTFRQKTKLDPIPDGAFLRMVTLTSQTGGDSSRFLFDFCGQKYRPPGARGWSTGESGLLRVQKSGRMWAVGTTLMWKNYHSDYPYRPRVSLWDDIRSSGFGSEKIYIVQTQPEAIQRCVLMTTDPGDLVLDPTCGSGTTAYVAEQWGRRWITVDTSRVALALARTRVMGARYPYYLLADSREGQAKEAEVTGTAPSTKPVHGSIRLGFVSERVPHITLKSIANNAEIDVIWDKWQAELKPLREKLNTTLKKQWEEWEIPREPDKAWPDTAMKLHGDWWDARIARQKEIDSSIVARAEFEYLYDKPYVGSKKVRVAGPFTVESLSPHRILGVDENDELIDGLKEDGSEYGTKKSFPEMVLENLKIAGVQQAHKEGRIAFTSLTPWPGDLVCAEGRYMEGESEKRAAIFIGPEFGTVQRADLVAAAREAGDASFDVLIACAFNYEATLKAEIDPEAWATLNSDTSRPFDKPKRGRIAVKVINHLGDEVMKVFKVA
jgi:adenine-specific DNA-methyltransferase